MGETDTSIWGWGEGARFLDERDRRELARRLETELGFPERPLLDPTPLESASIPEPTLTVPSAFEDWCHTDRESRARHTYGKGYRDLVRGFHGDYGVAPDVVARPRSEDDVTDLLAWASDERVAVIPFGGGTSVVGGVEPDLDGTGGPSPDGNPGQPDGASKAEYAGVVSLDLRELNEVLAVDETSRRARIQAGALGPEINAALGEAGLQLRHYPQSYEFSTLGGWIATRAGGHFGTVYTHIDDFVESVRAITPAGTLETLDVPASGAGPDPNRFLLGSEGAFGVITEAWVRVQPRPRYRSRAAIRFESFDDGVQAAREIAQARLYPAACRLLDPVEVLLNDIDEDGTPRLVLGFEGLEHPVERDLERAIEICARHDGTPVEGPTHEDRRDPKAGDEGEADEGETAENGADEGQSTDNDAAGADWRSSFVEAPYLFNALVSLGVCVETVETAVTWDRFPALHEAFRQRVTETMVEHCQTGVVSCRFTHIYPDGPAPYYTLLAPVDAGEEQDVWRAIKRTASETLADHEATITHHHAVGRVHRPWYEHEAPEAYLRALRSMKRTLDPAAIMNPGALVPPE